MDRILHYFEVINVAFSSGNCSKGKCLLQDVKVFNVCRSNSETIDVEARKVLGALIPFQLGGQKRELVLSRTLCLRKMQS